MPIPAFIPRNSSAALAALGLFALPAGANALSLDEAVALQLKEGCSLLRSAGGNPTGNLLALCDRVIATPPDPGPTTASGGGSTSPVTAQRNQQALEAEADTRQAALSQQWSLYLTLENEDLDRDNTATEGAFTSSIQRMQTGVTFMPSARASYSLAFTHSEQDGDFANGGDFQTDTNGLQALASFAFSDSLSLDVLAATAKADAKRTRNASFVEALSTITGTPDADFDFDQTGLTVQGNHASNSGPIAMQTFIGIDWLYSDYGTYSESGDSGLELTFHDDSKTSVQSRVGSTVSFAISTGFGVVVPQTTLVWHHEFKQDGRTVDVSFAEDANTHKFEFQLDDEEADYLNMGIGAALVFTGGLQAFVNVQSLLAHDYYDNLVFSAGMRQEL